MKTKILAAAFLIIGGNAFSQITVTDADIISVGDIVYQAVDSMPSNVISIGNSGANQVWDFSTLQQHEVDTIEVISPVGTTFESMYPNASFCIEADGELMYLEKSTLSLELVGYGGMPMNMLMLPLPLIYGLSQQIGPNTIMDSVFVNMFIQDTLAPYISLNPTYDQVDSLNIYGTVTSDFNVDAWGSVTIPMGTYDALRLNIEETTTTDFYAYCSSSLGLGGGWYPVPSQMFASETETTNRYQWWSNNVSTKFVLAELEVDSADNVEFASFLTDAQVLSVNNLNNLKVNVYPNPTADKVVVSTSNNNSEYVLVDVRGAILDKKVFNVSEEINFTNLPSGTYFITISSATEKVVKKIMKQ